MTDEERMARAILGNIDFDEDGGNGMCRYCMNFYKTDGHAYDCVAVIARKVALGDRAAETDDLLTEALQPLGDRAAEGIGESIEDRAKTPRGSAPNWSGTPADPQTPALVDALPNALGDRAAEEGR